MKILFVCHRLPYPPRRGGKIRPFNIIKHFTEAGHAVTVASLARSAQEASEGEGLSKYCTRRIIGRVSNRVATLRMVARLPTLSPSSMGFFYSRQLRREIEQVLARESFDLIMVHCSSVAAYVADVEGVPKILDFGDMDSQKWLLYSQHRGFPLAAGYWLEGTKLERAERELARKFDLCTCTTRAELETLQSFDTGVDTGWFPNGVDAEFFSPASGGYDSDRICFVGRMDYFPNQQAVLWFARHVLPLIRRQRPDTKFYVVGAAPSRSIQACDGRDGIVVTGTVDDVRPFVRQAAVTVAPLLIARGTQNKILESMAMGVPVVASEMAAGGVDAEPERHLLKAAASADFAEAVLRVLERPAERERLAVAGRERVLSHHAWAASLRRLDELVPRAMQVHGAMVRQRYA